MKPGFYADITLKYVDSKGKIHKQEMPAFAYGKTLPITCDGVDRIREYLKKTEDVRRVSSVKYFQVKSLKRVDFC